MYHFFHLPKYSKYGILFQNTFRSFFIPNSFQILMKLSFFPRDVVVEKLRSNVSKVTLQYLKKGLRRCEMCLGPTIFEKRLQQRYLASLIRSSRSKMFFIIAVLKNFAIFTGKHLCWSLFLIKFQAKRPEGLPLY